MTEQINKGRRSGPFETLRKNGPEKNSKIGQSLPGWSLLGPINQHIRSARHGSVASARVTFGRDFLNYWPISPRLDAERPSQSVKARYFFVSVHPLSRDGCGT